MAIEIGWVDHKLAAEFPELALRSVVVEAGLEPKLCLGPDRMSDCPAATGEPCPRTEGIEATLISITTGKLRQVARAQSQRSCHRREQPVDRNEDERQHGRDRYRPVPGPVRQADRGVRIAVHDNGPGVPDSLQPNVSMTRGAHNIRSGLDMRWTNVYNENYNNSGGQVTFNRDFTERTLNSTNVLEGNAFASFLLGAASGGTVDVNPKPHYQWLFIAPWIQDDWRVNNKLTLNLGFRLERPGAFTEKDDRIVVFDRDAVNPVLAGRTNPVTGQPFLGAFELVNSNEQSERDHRDPPASRSGQRHRRQAEQG